MDPMELLPPEIWEIIFDKIQDSKDWLNLFLASSSSFERVVGRKKVAALLSKVPSSINLQSNQGLRFIRSVQCLRLTCRRCAQTIDVISVWKTIFSSETRLFLNDITSETLHQAMEAEWM